MCAMADTTVAAARSDLLAVLAACTKPPDETFANDVASGALESELDRLVGAAGLDIDVPLEPPSTPTVGTLTEWYLALFEAMQMPYAPIAESPYKPWYGNREGLMDGPPAADMIRRYEAIESDPPAAYPADHLALLLEYGSLLLEGGHDEAFATFATEHYDWLPAFHEATDAAATDVPFYRWVVDVVDAVVAALRRDLDLPAPAEEERTQMATRVRNRA